jgi:hypothetical protein
MRKAPAPDLFSSNSLSSQPLNSEPPPLDWFKGRPLNCVVCGFGCWSTDGTVPMCRSCWYRVSLRPHLWPSWWTSPGHLDPAGADAGYFQPGPRRSPLATAFDRDILTFDDDDDHRSGPDPGVAHAIGLLLWFPPAAPGPLVEGTGAAPSWWEADQAAERMRRRFQTEERS